MSTNRLTLTALLLLPALTLSAQGTAADYARAESVRQRLDNLVVDLADPPTWIGTTSRVWYRKTVKRSEAHV